MAKVLTEKGIVVYKEYKAATGQWVKDDKVIAAQPERYIVTVLVGCIRKDGIAGATLISGIKTDAITYGKCEYLGICEVTYEYGGTYSKPIDFKYIGKESDLLSELSASRKKEA